MVISQTINQCADWLVSPFAGLNAIQGLALLSALSAVILLNLFKQLSNQDKIKHHKDKILGHFLEIAIYRDQFHRTTSNLLNVLWHNLLYIRYFLFPILLISIPMGLIGLQIEYRLGYQPLHPGDSFILKIELDNAVSLNSVAIKAAPGVILETSALRNYQARTIFWRAKITDHPAQPFIEIISNGVSTRKPLAITPTKIRFSPIKNRQASITDLLVSSEEAISPSSNIRTIEVTYQPTTLPFFSWRLSPLTYFLILTLGFGICLRPIIKVNI